MKHMPYISVVIPTLNESKYIKSTLVSIKNQDYKGKYEIIVSDSKGKDNTVKIARRYADKIVKSKDKGISLGRNKGAEIAKGKILIFIDADTILLPDTLTKIVKSFKNKNIVGATCTILPKSDMVDISLFLIFNQFIKNSIKVGKPRSAGICFAIRKDIFKKLNGFDETIPTFEDFELANRLGKVGKMAFVEDAIVITSSRRIKKWGRLNYVRKYMTKLIKFLAIGKAFSIKEYKPIR